MRIPSLWLVALTLATLTLSAQTTRPSADLLPSPELRWRDAIEKIEAARLSGRLTTDQAARYRLWALADPNRLPPEFQPSVDPVSLAAKGAPLPDGLPELAEKLDALFVDQAEWSTETRLAILAEFEEGERQSRAAVDALTETQTEHFAIHWDNTGGPDTPPDGFNYIAALAAGLERAWQELETYGYEMPNAAEFGKPVDLRGNARFDVFVVDDIGICDVIRIDRRRASAVTLPGDMWFFNDHDQGELDTMTAHELLHMLQWNYAAFRDSSCLGKLGAYSWYADKGAWLMESTATWIEDEIYPNHNDYVGKIRFYTRSPEISLFARTNLAPLHEYGAVIFIKFLQEHLADDAGYVSTRDIVRDIWENVPLRDNSTVGAVTYVLMHPPSGAAPYQDYTDTWRGIFDDFAVANYLKDYDDRGACTPAPGPQCWPDVKVVEVERPRARPVVPVEKSLPGFAAPGAQYVRILPTRLGLPGGNDATGAKLHLEFSTSCPNCSLDVLAFLANGTSTRTTLPLTMSGSIVFSASADLATDFGGAGGVTEVVLVVSNGPQDFFPQGYYDYTLTATDNPPETPTHLTATADANTLRDRWIELRWDQVREGGVTYNVYRSRTSPVPTDNAHRIASGVRQRRYRDERVNWETTYYYAVTAVDSAGNSSPLSAEASARLVLFENVQVAPNPFTPDGDGVDDVTRIAYTLALPPQEKRVAISAEILDSGGNLVRRLEVRPPVQGRGRHSVRWNGRRRNGTVAPVGLYTFRMTARSTSGGPPVVRRTGEVQLGLSACTDVTVVNWSFEEPTVSGPWIRKEEIPGWYGSFDLHADLAAVDGRQVVDLNQDDLGFIAQRLTTVPGARYEVTFSHGTNYYCTLSAQLSVDIDGRSVATLSSNATIATDTVAFTATAESTELKFRSLTRGCGAATIDKVSVGCAR